jgi:lysophospholipase L1-like esterase
MKNRGRLCQNLFLGVIVATLFFCVMELSLRLSPWNEMLGPGRFYGNLEDYSLFWHPDNIIKLPSDTDNLTDEFRGKKVSEAAEEGVYRILCLGGSFTYGWPYVNQEWVAYPACLERSLNNRAEDENKFEVINAGIGGYTSYQGLFYFKNRLYRLNPDLITICFGANDTNNSNDVDTFCSDKEYYERLRDLSDNKVLSGIKQHLNNLRVYALMEKLIINTKKIFIKPRIRVPPRDFGDNLAEFIKLSEEQNFKILFILEPHINLSDFEQEIKENAYYNIMYKLAMENPESVKLADTISLFRRYQDRDMFYDEMHLLPSGHKLLAEYITEIFITSGFYNEDGGRKNQ